MTPEELLTPRALRRAQVIAHRDPRHVQRERNRRRLRARLALVLAARRAEW